MNLTRREYKALQYMIEDRDSSPTVIRSVARSRLKYLYMVLVASGASAFLWWGGWPVVALSLFSYFFGVLARDFMWLSVRNRFWPVTREIIDWSRVDELVRAYETKGP